MRVGFVGLGDQGGGIARGILSAGHDVVLWARRAASLDPFQNSGARIAPSCREVGRDVDVLATCVFDAEGTREVLFGSDGAAAAMRPGAVVIVHSTVSPEEIVSIAERARADHGLAVLDAPVSGGGVLAARGELTTIVGGDEQVYRRALPLLEAFSRLVVHVGGVGAGQRAKLLNNTLLAAHVGLAVEVLDVGEHLGLDPQALAQVLVNGSGRSFGVEMVAGAGSLAAIARTQARPALIKDVDLLTGYLEAEGVGESLVRVARGTTAALAACGEH